MFDLLIKNGKVFTAGSSFFGNIGIKSGKIVYLGTDDSFTGISETVDAEGLYVLPGGIDPHVHLDMPVGDTRTIDDFKSGTKAALFGGTTSIIDFATPEKGQTLSEAVEVSYELADASFCDYSFHCAIPEWNEKIKKELYSLPDKGITSCKVYTAYPDRLMLDDKSLIELFHTANDIGLTVLAHCENGFLIDYLEKKIYSESKKLPALQTLLRTSDTEAEAVNRVITYSKAFNTKLVIAHISTKDALDKVIRSSLNGFRIMTEACIHHLVLDDELYDNSPDETAKFIAAPPLRSQCDRNKLWLGIANNIINIISTDHCAFNIKGQKDKYLTDFTKMPNGVPGIEERLKILFTFGVLKDLIGMTDFVRLTSTNAAIIYGLYPKKGDLIPGSDADVVLWNPDYSSTISAKTHHSNSDYSPYEGMKVFGKVEKLFLKGKFVIDSNKFLLDKCVGEFLPRNIS